jgi:hypothetical protein
MAGVSGGSGGGGARGVSGRSDIGAGTDVGVGRMGMGIPRLSPELGAGGGLSAGPGRLSIKPDQTYYGTHNPGVGNDDWTWQSFDPTYQRIPNAFGSISGDTGRGGGQPAYQPIGGWGLGWGRYPSPMFGGELGTGMRPGMNRLAGMW